MFIILYLFSLCYNDNLFCLTFKDYCSPKTHPRLSTRLASWGTSFTCLGFFLLSWKKLLLLHMRKANKVIVITCTVQKNTIQGRQTLYRSYRFSSKKVTKLLFKQLNKCEYWHKNMPFGESQTISVPKIATLKPKFTLLASVSVIGNPVYVQLLAPMKLRHLCLTFQML